MKYDCANSPFLLPVLVDKYRIRVHQVILGKGKPLFEGLPDQLKLQLNKTTNFTTGIVLLFYSATNLLPVSRVIVEKTLKGIQKKN